MYLIDLSANHFELAVQAIELELRHLARGGGPPIAEGALERAAPVRFPQTDPLLSGIALDQRVERAVEERRRQLLQIAHALDRRRPDELTVGEIADPAHAGPIPRRQAIEEIDEGPLTLIVNDQVDERVRAQEGLAWSGTCGPPKMISWSGLRR